MAYTLNYKLINNDTEYEVRGCRGEPVDVVIPSTFEGKPVTIIGQSAFLNCESLTSITLPDSITSIDSHAFYSCTSLTSIIIPDSVTSIGYAAFHWCTSLMQITLLGKTPPTLSDVNFEKPENCKFYCLSSALDDYKTATNWNRYANQFVADDIRLYFIMNANAQKKYFADKNYILSIIQPLLSKIETLEARIAELEAK